MQRLSVFGAEKEKEKDKHSFHALASEWNELHVLAEKIPTEIVPSHFLDPITCSLMLNPVMLPSGQVVDVKTSTLCSLSMPLLPLLTSAQYSDT